VSSIAPLLDFFKRGEVERDVKLLAAQGVLAPRAHEQLAILILLLDDRDAEVRTTAAQTIDRIPLEALRAFLGRSDVPIGIREFFADRGVFPAEIPAITAESALFDAASDDADDSPDAEEDGEKGETLVAKLQNMGFTERLKAAMRGSREMRAILIRDANKMVSAAVLSSPKVTESEVESFARMTTLNEEVLRIIANNRAWLKNYGIVVALARNAKTPLAISLNLLARLNERDVSAISVDRNVPDPLRQAARRKVVLGHSR
jgi:hypothetical protein